MKTLNLFALASVFLALGSAQSTQSAQKPEGAQKAESAQKNESLLIGPGDELKIDVFDTPEMSQLVRVTDSGEIPLVFLGNLKVENLTPGQAGQAIADALKAGHYMKHPQVTVTVETFGTQQVSVIGQVHSAGTFSITAPVSILNVLSNAGGVTDTADRHILIQRHGDPNQIVKFFLSNDSETALRGGVMVYPGDIVVVPKAGVVYVLGDVGRPGGYTMSDNDSQMTVLQALAIAGAANKTAIVSKAKLVRKTTAGTTVEVPIKLGAIERGKAEDVAMQPNDVLYVPFSYMKNIALNGTQVAASAASAIIYTHP